MMLTSTGQSSGQSSVSNDSLQQPRTDLQQGVDGVSGQTGTSTSPQATSSFSQDQLQANGLRVGDSSTVIPNTTTATTAPLRVDSGMWLVWLMVGVVVFGVILAIVRHLTRRWGARSEHDLRQSVHAALTEITHVNKPLIAPPEAPPTEISPAATTEPAVSDVPAPKSPPKKATTRRKPKKPKR